MYSVLTMCFCKKTPWCSIEWITVENCITTLISDVFQILHISDCVCIFLYTDFILLVFHPTFSSPVACPWSVVLSRYSGHDIAEILLKVALKHQKSNQITFSSVHGHHCEKVSVIFNSNRTWSWSYGSWIYNYTYNLCISPLKLWVWILLRRSVLDATLCDKVLSVTCGRSVVFSGYSGFLHQ